MPKHLLPFVAVTLFLLNLYACNNECDEPTQIPLKFINYSLPYNGYDTLRFLHNNTDTQTFIGQGLNYFWVRKPPFDDTQCPEDHQSLYIQFKNLLSGKSFRLEYIYDYAKFYDVLTYNNYTYFKFYCDDIKFELPPQTVRSSRNITIGNVSYSYVTFFYNQNDTLQYIVYREPTHFLLSGGILKLKLNSNDSYEIIK